MVLVLIAMLDAGALGYQLASGSKLGVMVCAVGLFGCVLASGRFYR